MDKITVLIVDDHKIVRVGLRGILEREADVRVVGEASGEDEVVAVLRKQVTDVVLMDIDLGSSSGIEITSKIKKDYPDLKVLALTMQEEKEKILGMLQAGASGYLLKDAGRDELLTAIRTVAEGNSYFSKRVSDTLLKTITATESRPPKSSSQILSDREIEVLKLISEEHSNAEIAEKLFISVRTVDTHRRNILEKLGVKNTAGMVRYAIERGLI